MNPRHRQATCADADRLWELRRASIVELAPRGMSVVQAERWAANPTIDGMRRKIRETEVWVAEVHDRIVGWVAIRGDYLDGLYTDPQWERQGIGTHLLTLAEGRARRKGWLTLRAEASWNAEGFYSRRGYEPTGPRPADGARPVVKRLTDQVHR